MKYLAIILASLCLSLPAFSQQQILPVLQTFYVRGNNGDDLVPSSQQSFQYDKHDRLRVDKNYGWIEEEKRWAPGYSVESDYDDVGKSYTANEHLLVYTDRYNRPCAHRHTNIRYAEPIDRIHHFQ